MAKVKVASRSLSIPQKIQLTRRIVSAMTNNVDVPSPTPTLAVLTAAANVLETAFNEAQIARREAVSKTALQTEASKALDHLLTRLGNYVESATNGDKAKIANAGFNVRAASLPVGELAAPDNFKVSPSIIDGSANLKWDRVIGSKGYVVERAQDALGNLNWLPAGSSTRSKVMLNSMASGTNDWFRVAALGAAGLGLEPVGLVGRALNESLPAAREVGDRCISNQAARGFQRKPKKENYELE